MRVRQMYISTNEHEMINKLWTPSLISFEDMSFLVSILRSTPSQTPLNYLSDQILLGPFTFSDAFVDMLNVLWKQNDQRRHKLPHSDDSPPSSIRTHNVEFWTLNYMQSGHLHVPSEWTSQDGARGSWELGTLVCGQGCPGRAATGGWWCGGPRQRAVPVQISWTAS